MKRVIQPFLLGTMGALISSCGGLAPSGDYDSSTDPLDSPGSQRRAEAVNGGPRYAPGSYVEVTDANAGLYRRFPKGDMQPSTKLVPGTQLKVLSEKGSYVRVETESGQIGYVPAIMVRDRMADSTLVPLEGTALPLAPVDSTDLENLPPLPPADPSSFVAPEPEVPPISVERSGTPAPAPAPADE
ncbi:MAG: SH3 domain-containing protein [Roseibacillus sp.]|nr:SH3 domain-containing protein [Roseibacillus sp.]MDP6206882.1 SH3 domain-containing protein [Roseibacillus sp.]